jgi:hypothetical protein
MLADPDAAGWRSRIILGAAPDVAGTVKVGRSREGPRSSVNGPGAAYLHDAVAVKVHDQVHVKDDDQVHVKDDDDGHGSHPERPVGSRIAGPVDVLTRIERRSD